MSIVSFLRSDSRHLCVTNFDRSFPPILNTSCFPWLPVYTKYPLGAVTASGRLKSLSSSGSLSSWVMRWCSKHSAIVRGGLVLASSMS